MSSADRPVLHVTVYSDYTCPWCYLGSRRLDQLQQTLGDRAEIRALWKPFEIHPEVPPHGMPVAALPYPPARFEQMMAHLRAQAAEEGLALADRTHLSNTHRALVASAYAQAEEPEHFHSFHEAIFDAYFGQGRDLNDPAVLRDAAGASGLDVDRMEAALQASAYEHVLWETTDEALRYGIHSTPTYVFDDRYAVVGAQPVAALERVAEAALKTRRGDGQPPQ